ncbi:monooxygenase FAD-binding protein [Trametes elegans]|nr:monooxygenase FAD-binding protein [Trametes elegans]
MSTSSNGSQTQPRIAIVGGGPGGLVLLLTLLRRGIPATLYERDSSRNTRAHLGGTLDLEWDSGQRALRENGLEDHFKAYARRDAEEMRICGKHGVPVLLHDGGDPPDNDLQDTRPEIDRRVLRQILLDALPQDAIRWDHALAFIRPLGGGQHELTFANGSPVVVADLVVGADGAHSRIRPLVSPATPLYHGVTGAEISLAPGVAARPENDDIGAGVGRGTCLAAQGGKIVCFQRNGDGRIRAYAWHRAPLEWALPRDPGAAKEGLLALYADWAPWIRKFIALCDEDAIYPRPLFYLPVGHRWAHVPGVTIIGDAAHLMSPFAGAGANLAMLDGLELGLALAQAQKEGGSAEKREKAVAAWEQKMFDSVEKVAAETYRNLQAFISPDAPESAVAAVREAVSQGYE